MGLFSVFRKKPQAAPPKDGLPDLRTGMRVEVLTPTGVPLFTGRIRLLGSQGLEVRAEDGGFLPRRLHRAQHPGTLADRAAAGPAGQPAPGLLPPARRHGGLCLPHGDLQGAEAPLQGPGHQCQRRAGDHEGPLQAGEHLLPVRRPPPGGAPLLHPLSCQACPYPFQAGQLRPELRVRLPVHRRACPGAGAPRPSHLHPPAPGPPGPPEPIGPRMNDAGLRTMTCGARHQLVGASFSTGRAGLPDFFERLEALSTKSERDPPGSLSLFVMLSPPAEGIPPAFSAL